MKGLQMNIKDRHIKFYEGKDIPWQNWGKAFYEHLKQIDCKSVCDVGCGNGQFVIDMVQKYNFEEAYGVDIATVDLGMTIQNTKVKYFSADASEIPLGDKSVDLVTAFDSLEHVDENRIEETLKELSRICKKNFMFSISFRKSGETVGEYNLHSCVRPKAWWYKKIPEITGATLESEVESKADHSSTLWKL